MTLTFVTTTHPHYVTTQALTKEWEALNPDEQFNYETTIVLEHMKHWGCFVEVKRQQDGPFMGWYSIGTKNERYLS